MSERNQTRADLLEDNIIAGAISRMYQRYVSAVIADVRAQQSSPEPIEIRSPADTRQINKIVLAHRRPKFKI